MLGDGEQHARKRREAVIVVGEADSAFCHTPVAKQDQEEGGLDEAQHALCGLEFSVGELLVSPPSLLNPWSLLDVWSSGPNLAVAAAPLAGTVTGTRSQQVWMDAKFKLRVLHRSFAGV